ncbi:MAG: hypothetical protein WBP80_02715, partial [Planifilum fulgidum]
SINGSDQVERVTIGLPSNIGFPDRFHMKGKFVNPLRLSCFFTEEAAPFRIIPFFAREPSFDGFPIGIKNPSQAEEFPGKHRDSTLCRLPPDAFNAESRRDQGGSLTTSVIMF